MRRDGEWRRGWDELLANIRRKPFIGIDFDGVIAKSTVNGPTTDGIDAEVVVDPETGMTSIEFIREAVKHFWVVICSTRCCIPAAKGVLAAWLVEKGLEKEVLKQLTITDQKPPGIILDDRGWRFTGQFPSMAELLAFIPWHGGGIIDSDRGKDINGQG